MIPTEARFEAAVECVIHGDAAGLGEHLAADPNLVRTRSHRDHGAMLLHYTAANGVEGERQLSPPNLVEIAGILLDAGAEPDALCDLYGGKCTTLSLLVSSTPPAQAGVQVPLVELLLDRGAAVEGVGEGNWVSPLQTALVFGFLDAAEALVRRGAKVDTVDKAAGLNRLEEVRRMLPESTPHDRHRALALAAQLGRNEVVALLLDAGEDPNRFNPPGSHAHATPLHHAALGGHMETVRILLNHGADRTIPDSIWHATPAGWADHGGHPAVAELLRNGR